MEATGLLRSQRPDLKSQSLICVRLVKDWAVCLDLREKPEDDCPLVTVSLKNKEIPIIQTHHSFKEAIEETIREKKKAQAARQRVANRREEVEERREREFSHTRKKGQPYPLYPRPRDWHPLIRRVHDDVVGRTAFRYNSRFSALEVDEFYAPDHPEYKEGEPLKSLLISIFGGAHSLGGSLDIIFTKDIREDEETKKIRERNWQRILPTLSPELREEAEENNGRIHRLIPQELVELAEKYGITFKDVEEGRINHKEGVELFIRLFEFPTEVRKKIDELVEKGYFTKEALCFIVAAGIWSREEAIWFFLNVPRPEAVILGTGAPESRLLHSESVNWGISVYLTSLLRQKILVDLSGGLSEEERSGVDCILEPREEFWILQANQEFYLPWQIKGSEPVLVKAEESVLILSRPQQTSQPDADKAWLERNVEFLAKVESEAKIRCLLLSFEFSDLKYGMKVSEEMKEVSRETTKRGVYLLFSPYKLDILNNEAEERMAKARRLKHFEPRSCPLKLQVIEVPSKIWQEPALKFSVEDALSAGSWIAKRIDLRLGRIRFRTNCQVVERIALQDSRNKIIAEFDGKESEKLLETLKSEQGITLPFVQPEEMPEFLEKLIGELRSTLSKVQGGIVVAVPPYEKSVTEPKVREIEKPVITRVPTDFQFSVNPEEIDFSRYRQGYRKAEIQRFHEQVQTALRTGEPLAVSYLPHELFPEVMRDYIYYTTYTEYQEKPFLFFWKRRVKQERRDPPELVMLRISYQDGTEGKPFPLFSLPEPKESPEFTNFYEFKIGSISMRHVNLDLITEGYLMTNMMMKKKGRESASAQEDYAFRMTWHFLTNFIDLIQHKRVEEIIQEVKFRFLWNWLKEIREKSYVGLKLHIFQTGLEPAVVGMYRAVLEFLQKRRGELVVTPRLISERELRRLRKEKGIKGITEDVYLRTAEWF
ncbi:MAG: hypothetical protein DDT22_00728 [candidate division WS2 bacterium]|nr:hypothetical protein [Candidatus Lithacetigena glycinireducens]MBT9175054.1 hypothetical protein [Candidatus Lithacetigena glycinireducens]